MDFLQKIYIISTTQGINPNPQIRGITIPPITPLTSYAAKDTLIAPRTG